MRPDEVAGPPVATVLPRNLDKSGWDAMPKRKHIDIAMDEYQVGLMTPPLLFTRAQVG